MVRVAALERLYDTVRSEVPDGMQPTYEQWGRVLAALAAVEQAAPEGELEGQKRLNAQIKRFLDEHQIQLADARAAIREAATALSKYVNAQEEDWEEPHWGALHDAWLALPAVVAARTEKYL